MRLILKAIALQFFKRVKEGRETYHRTHYTKHLFIIIKQWNMAQIICKEKLYYIYNLIKSHNSPSNLTEYVHTRQKFGEMAKSRILVKLGWVDQLMGVVDHDQYFWSGATLMGVADPP